MTAARAVRHAPLELRGKRVLLRSLTENDFAAWHEVRTRCASWLLRWEPRPKGAPAPSEDRPSFAARCGIRERERHLGTGYGFGIFVGERFAGEVTLSSIQRGPFQSGVHRVLGRRGAGGTRPGARGRRGHPALRLRGDLVAPGGDLHHPEEHGQPAGRREARHPRGGHRPALPRDRRSSGRTTCATASRRRNGPCASGAGRGVARGPERQASPPPTTDGEWRKNCSTSCS